MDAKEEAEWCIARLNESKLRVITNDKGKPEFNQESIVHLNVIQRTIKALLSFNKERVEEQEAKLAKMPSVEEIRRIIIEKELQPAVCLDSGEAEWTVGESKKLATAIHNRLKED